MFHRNSQKRIIRDSEIYFVTSKTKNNFPFFEEPIFCELWIEELQLAKKLKGFELFAFALNYDHFHLVVKPRGEENVSRIMEFLKRHVSRCVNILTRCTEGDLREGRLRGGVFDSLTDQISEHDKRLQNYRHQFLTKHGHDQNKFPAFSWQRSFHDHVIRNPTDFTHHINYTIWNHLKHGLPEDWKYTSLNFPKLIDPSA